MVVKAQLLSLADTCQATGLGITVVKRLVADGEIDSIKVGRRRLVLAQGIERFIAQRLQTAGPTA